MKPVADGGDGFGVSVSGESAGGEADLRRGGVPGLLMAKLKVGLLRGGLERGGRSLSSAVLASSCGSFNRFLAPQSMPSASSCMASSPCGLYCGVSGIVAVKSLVAGANLILVVVSVDVRAFPMARLRKR